MNGFNWFKFVLFLFFLAIFSIGLAINCDEYGLGISWFGVGGILYIIVANMFNYLNNNE